MNREVHVRFRERLEGKFLRATRPVNELSQEHNVHPTQIAQWKKELQENAASLFEKKRGPVKVNETSDPERLYSEIGKLKVELDWLHTHTGH